MNDTVTALRNVSKWFEAHGRNSNSAVVDICNDAAAQLESQQVRLAETQQQLQAAAKCIYDVETYLELGSGKYAYGVIQHWRGPQEAEKGEDPL